MRGARGDRAEWDFIIIGSGFGGSVCALRLVEKGYRVLMLERGRRFSPDDFARTNWDVRRWLWWPALGLRGPFKMTFLRHVTALSGVGVGGGSLVYANTLPTPTDEFFRAPAWGQLADWKDELAPHYETARRMLGATPVPFTTPPDEILRRVADELDLAHAWRPTEVGVFFGEPGVTTDDPYFGGAGPKRAGCIRCGGCMLGCRHGAKNTLDKNYLWLAERQGLKLLAETEARWVRPHEGTRPGYEVTARTSGWKGGRTIRFLTENVIFAGGVLGTLDLLLRLRASPSGLPLLSPRLGEGVRTNSEVLMGVVTSRELDLSTGVAIGSILSTDARSHLEPVRYPAGSGFFRLLALPHAPGETLRARLTAAWRELVRRPRALLRAWLVRDWAKRTMILLYMRAAEGTLTLRLGRAPLAPWRRRLSSAPGLGPAPRASLPEATDLARRVERALDGVTQSMLTETLLGTPTTAHILGGCGMGADASAGVIDARHRVFGYAGLYVVDGSAISANPGVNPSLTITALAERAMALIPPAHPLNGQR